MKKLLTAFAAFGMMATTGATAMTVVSCGNSIDWSSYFNMTKSEVEKALNDIKPATEEDAAKMSIEDKVKGAVLACMSEILANKKDGDKLSSEDKKILKAELQAIADGKDTPADAKKLLKEAISKL